jgi:hypothetical protein
MRSRLSRHKCSRVANPYSLYIYPNPHPDPGFPIKNVNGAGSASWIGILMFRMTHFQKNLKFSLIFVSLYIIFNW